MAYQAKRKKQYTEDFELVDENGSVVHTLHVNLDPDAVAEKLSGKYAELQRSLQELQSADLKKDPEKAMETIGKTALDILEAVFGINDTETIVDFYDGRLLEMAKEVMPFITGEVIPTVRKLAQENRKGIMARYSRKQRRMFGRS